MKAYIDGAIEEVRLGFDWTSQEVRVSVKSVTGSIYIDVRKWIKDQVTGEYHPRSGVMIGISEWPKVMEAISKLSESYK